jgi:hypothetical protein
MEGARAIDCAIKNYLEGREQLCPFVVKRRGMLPVTLSVPSENLSFLEV